ncbi:hypothetical protein D3C72_2268410 [compost metagenome]
MPAVVVAGTAKRLNRVGLAVALIITKGNVGLLPWGYLNKVKVCHIRPGLQRKLGLRLLIGSEGAKAGVLILDAKAEI